MILFYWCLCVFVVYFLFGFQFHYDLILLIDCSIASSSIVIFQFHYDLILLQLQYNIHIHEWRFQFHYDLILLKQLFYEPFLFLSISISLWSYSIVQQYKINFIIGSDFNFIMILFYCTTIQNKLHNWFRFQFHYDLILFLVPYPPCSGEK